MHSSLDLIDFENEVTLTGCVVYVHIGIGPLAIISAVVLVK